MQSFAYVKKKRGSLISYEENRSLIQGNIYVSVNEMQVDNIHLSAAYNESNSLQRLQVKSWRGL